MSTATDRVEVDELDLRILAVLQRDGRITKANLAQSVGLSVSACLERMRRLEKKRSFVPIRQTSISKPCFLFRYSSRK